MNKAALPKIALIAGPTASGKSALALALADQTGGTIINADSAQVYRDLRILTARPSIEDEARAPHLLFGHVDGADTGYSAARWAAEARGAIDATLAAGRLPILVGGTGLYLRTLIDGIAPVPAIDPAVRDAVRTMSVAAAHDQLEKLDPSAAARLHPRDTTRVARALEVIRSTGTSLAAWQATHKGGIGGSVAIVGTVLLPAREHLFTAIDQRTATMLDTGAIEEAAALLARSDVPSDGPIRRAIGVAACAALLSGATDRTTTETQLALDTRRYAKRQMTWLRHQPPETWARLNDYSSDNLSSIIKLLTARLTR